MTAISLTVLLVATAMVLDFGLVRLDRQQVKALSDEAVMAGIVAGDGGTGEVYPFRATCGALSYLKSDPRLAGLPDGLCTSSSLTPRLNTTCTAAASTHAQYDQSVTSGAATYRVVITSPYVLTDGTWPEESLPTSAADQSLVGGCDQIGVQVFERRPLGLGTLAGSDESSFGIRSAARAVMGGDDELSPALIVLERTACSALTVGSAGGGSGTYIQVHGSGPTPGSIHVDSSATGADCGGGSNQQLLQGKQSDGIVAYGSVAPTGVAGVISSVATYSSVAATVVSDNLNNVYGTTATTGTGADKGAVQGRRLVGRTPIDKRYRTGVRSAIAAAAGVWATSAPSGWTTTGCNPSAADLAVTTRLWINCTGNSGITLSSTISAGEVYFNGFVKNGTVSMPNATKVYLSNTAANGSTISGSALTMGNGNGFCVRSTCSTTPTIQCTRAATANRATVFVRQGSVDATGGILRLCNTTMILLGGDTGTGCVPAVDGLAPTTTPCTTSPAAGNGTISVTGGAVFDWTSPNQYASTIPTANQSVAWSLFEDLAMWSESSGSFKFGGGGGMDTVGVYMVPNGSPVSVGGGSSQTLTNAQYISRTFAVSGGGTLSLTTDPKNAVTIPTIKGFLLVR